MLLKYLLIKYSSFLNGFVFFKVAASFTSKCNTLVLVIYMLGFFLFLFNSTLSVSAFFLLISSLKLRCVAFMYSKYDILSFLALKSDFRASIGL
jgi:hypothetical protein